MVARLKRIAFGAGLSLLLIPVPVGAQETLEKIQNDVAAIVKATKSAVVSIEDERLYIKVEGVDIGNAVADALKEAEKELQRISRRAENAQESPAKSEENRKAKAEAAKRYSELKSHMSVARAQIREQLPGRFNFNIDNAPKSGTGFSIGDGFVVTTADVLNGMKSPVVVMDDMTRIKAIVVGVDTDLNIGLLKLPAQAKVASLKWGNSSAVQIGHFAVSIGNQNGQTNSVSLALVAGLRTEGTFSGNHFYPSLIQIAGTVGAGSSGAPLINPRGEIIAMLAGVPAGDWTEMRMPEMIKGFIPPAPGGKLGFKVQPGLGGVRGGVRAAQAQLEEDSPDGDQQGSFTFIRPPVTSAGFAIPVNMVREVVDKLRTGSPIQRGWIGITPEDEREAKTEGDITTFKCYVRIKDVFVDSPACKAGLREGDLLVSLNGKPVTCSDEVRSTSAMLKPGDHLAVVVRRSGENRKFELQIDQRPEKIQPKKPKENKEIKKTDRTGALSTQRQVMVTFPNYVPLKECASQPTII
jgi:S1-C subfamily serine protease